MFEVLGGSCLNGCDVKSLITDECKLQYWLPPTTAKSLMEIVGEVQNVTAFI